MKLGEIERITSRVVKLRYPEIYQDALSVIEYPRLTDWSLVKPIYEDLFTASENPHEEMHYFIGVLFKVFAPLTLAANLKLPVGLRDVISEAMGYLNPEMVNYHSTILRPYLKNPRFAKRVEDEATRIINKYSNQDKNGRE